MVALNFGIIIQARTSSTRYPEKVLKKIDKKNTVLDFQIKRVLNEFKNKYIFIATTTEKKDKKICLIAKKNNVNFFRGSEKNVLKRYIDAAEKFDIKNIVRITADCPFADPKIIDKFITKYFIGKFNYVSNVNPPSFPNGFDVEIVSLKLLKKSFKIFKDNMNKEHVTYAIREKKINKFMKVKSFNFKNSKNLNHIRLTLDNKKDLKKIKRLARHINIADGWKSIYLKNKIINNEK